MVLKIKNYFSGLSILTIVSTVVFIASFSIFKDNVLIKMITSTLFIYSGIVDSIKMDPTDKEKLFMEIGVLLTIYMLLILSIFKVNIF